MYTLYTKPNRLMVANQFNIEPASIICNDVMLPFSIDEANRYNPHNVRLWLIGHMHGPVCAIFAGNEQEALDAACNANKMESFMLSKDELAEYDHDNGGATALGNASELHNLDDCWIAEVDLQPARDILLIVKLARAAEGGHDTLDF